MKRERKSPSSKDSLSPSILLFIEETLYHHGEDKGLSISIYIKRGMVEGARLARSFLYSIKKCVSPLQSISSSHHHYHHRRNRHPRSPFLTTTYSFTHPNTTPPSIFRSVLFLFFSDTHTQTNKRTTFICLG
jgi:hypothetical protein